MKKVLKRSLSLLLAITIIFGSAAVGLSEVEFGRLFAVKAKAATSGTTGACTWTLNGTVLTIRGNGAMNDNPPYYNHMTPWGKSITSVIIENGVTSIGDGAFFNCTSLTSVIISGSVTSIGWSAFSYCTSLESVTIPDSVTSIDISAFSNCTSLESVTIPDSVISIGFSAFSDCTSLTSVTIGDNVKSIGDDAFNGCIGLEKIYWNAKNVSDFSIKCPDLFCNAGTSGSGIEVVFGDTVEEIPAKLFCSSELDNSPKVVSVTIGENVTRIGEDAFFIFCNIQSVYITDIAKWCGIDFENVSSNPLKNNLYLDGELVTDLVIPNSVTSIGDYAFSYCISLTSVTIPNSVTSIGWGAFSCCRSLTSVTIPNSVTSIGDFAFSYCTSLTSVTIPNSVTSIGDYAFGSCISLTSITIPNSVTCIDCAFSGCTSLTSITIPNSVTSIDGAFSGCTSLASITIPNSVTSIDGAFSGCKSLTSITIPNSVTSIDGAFYDCTSLTSITIPNSVTSVGKSAFGRCRSLTSVTIGDSVTSIEEEAFSYCTSLTSITIPNSVTSIGRLAFRSAGLASITIPDSVTSIGDRAFYECTSLASVTIGDSVTSIDECTFYNCTSLTSVIIGDGVTRIGQEAFYDCTSLAFVTIGDSVTSIGRKAFYRCKGLEKIYWNAKKVSDFISSYSVFYNAGTSGSGIDIVFGDTVEKIPAYLFCSSNSNNSPKVNSVTIGKNVTRIGEDAFCDCINVSDVYITDIAQWCGIDFENFYSNPLKNNLYLDGELVTDLVIPNGVASIGDYAFSNCTSLTSITIPDSVTIGEWAFYDCTRITSITIGDGVTSIGHAAFYGCARLKSVTIGDSVTSIGHAAFYGCTSLTSVTIGDSVTSIGDSAFSNCTSLTSITIPNSVASIGDSAFSNCTRLTSIIIPDSVTSIGEGAFYDCTSLTSVTISDSVTSVGNSAFGWCRSLTSVTIGDSVTSIGGGAFYNCRSLTSITIPDSVTSIGERAFYNCDSLTSITIPDSVTSISDEAFSNCTSLTSITIPDSVTSIGENAFQYCSSLNEVTTPCNSYASTYFNKSKLKLTHTSSSDWIVDKNATCTKPGSMHGTCIVCGNSATSVIPAGHTIFEWMIDINATCTDMGSKYGTCIICGELTTKEIAALGHNVVVDTGKTPTCITAGKTEGSHCSVCNAVIVAQTTIPAKGHTAVKDAAVAATCTKPGKTEGSHCSVCNTIIKAQTTIPAKGHTAVQDAAVAATCTKPGKTEGSHCSVCNIVIKAQTAIPATGHKSSSWIIDKEATVSAPGSKHKECTVCKVVLERATIAQHKPATPTTSTTNESNGVKITWNAVTDVTKYNVYRRQAGQTAWTLVGTTAGNTITDTKVTSGIYYCYSVRAYNSAGSYSDFDTTKTVTIQPITAPTAVATNHTNGVQVKWNASSGATKYNVYRRIGGSSSWVLVGTTTGTSLVDTGVTNGKYFVYSIRAINSTGYSAFDTKKTDTIQPVTAPTAVATNLTTGVQVKWNASSGATKYNVYRRIGGSSSWVLVGTTTGTSLIDKGVTNGKYYVYSIRAINGTGYSAFDTKKTDTIQPITAPTAKVAKKSTGVQVSWNKVTGATKYNIYRRLGGTSTWVYVGTTTNTTLLDKGVVKGKSYAYSIRAINGTGYSAYNSSKCASIKYS